MQEVRLRQARRHRETLRAVQGKTAAILERSQESWRRSRWRVAGGDCRREDAEEIAENLFTKQTFPLYVCVIPSSIHQIYLIFPQFLTNIHGQFGHIQDDFLS